MNTKYAFPVVAVAVIILIALGMYCWQTKNSKGTLGEKQESDWTKYTNEQLGFSLHIPKTMLGVDRCSDREFYVPVKVIENNEQGEVYIVPEYYYFEKSPDSQECNKIAYSLETIKEDGLSQGDLLKPWLGWAVTVKPIKNDNELEAFIKQKFGSDCTLGEKEFAAGEYDGREVHNNVSVVSGGFESNCPLNYQYKVIFSDEVQKAMAVELGQECKFFASSDLHICYDEIMADSFRWE